MHKYLKLAALFAISITLGACSPLSKETQLASAEPVDPDIVRCKRVVKTGTRISTKDCRTNRAWEQAAQDGKDSAEAVQRSSTQTPTVGGG